MSHRNAGLAFHRQRLLVERVQSGQAVRHVATAMAYAFCFEPSSNRSDMSLDWAAGAPHGH